MHVTVLLCFDALVFDVVTVNKTNLCFSDLCFELVYKNFDFEAHPEVTLCG